MKRRNTPAWKHLVNLLLTGSDNHRVDVSEAFCRCRSRRGTNALMALLQSYDSPRVSELAAYTLMQIGCQRFVPALASCVRDKSQHEAVRGQAAEALGQTTYGSGCTGKRLMRVAESALLEALTDPSPTVRFWCCFALGNLKSQRAVPLLMHLRDHDREIPPGWWYVWEEAADALDGIAGGPGEDRVPVHLRHKDAV